MAEEAIIVVPKHPDNYSSNPRPTRPIGFRANILCPYSSGGFGNMDNKP
jgi:hypothetical protein